MPLDTEVVPPHGSPVPPILRPQTLIAQGKEKAQVQEEPAKRPSASSTLAATRRPAARFKPAFASSNVAVRSNSATPASAAPIKPEVTTIDESRNQSSYVDPEKRALDEMTRIRASSGARQAFYEDLRHTVEQVRAGEKVENETIPATSHP
jgi:hypothetical protein